jgi:hypothetical protein
VERVANNVCNWLNRAYKFKYIFIILLIIITDSIEFINTEVCRVIVFIVMFFVLTQYSLVTVSQGTHLPDYTMSSRRRPK